MEEAQDWLSAGAAGVGPGAICQPEEREDGLIRCLSHTEHSGLRAGAPPAHEGDKGKHGQIGEISGK